MSLRVWKLFVYALLVRWDVGCLMSLLWVDETFSKEERDRKKEISEAMVKKMSGILRKRGRAESLDDEEHVMLLMSKNNYLSMFKDKLTLISVLLYGLDRGERAM